MPNYPALEALQLTRARRVRKAEKASGYREMVGFLRGVEFEISVTFYPTTKWWFDSDGQRIQLTPELWRDIQAHEAGRI